MIVKPTRQHNQIEIDVKLTRDKYSVNALITKVYMLLKKKVYLLI